MAFSANSRTEITQTTVSQLAKKKTLGLIRDDYPLQRHAEQHSKAYIDGFIATAIKGEDFDSIKICELVDTKILYIIDGFQRTSELEMFKNQNYKLGSNIEFSLVDYYHYEKDANGNTIPVLKNFDLKGATYDSLPAELQDQFDDCPVTIVMHRDCTPEEIAYHFRRYNHNKSLNATQVCVSYCESMAGEIKKITSNNKFFKDTCRFTLTSQRNGDTERIVMDSIMTTFHLDDYVSSAEKNGKYINNNTTEEEFNMLNNLFTIVDKHGEGCYVHTDKTEKRDFFGKKNTFLFIPVLNYSLSHGISEEKFFEFLDKFEDSIRFKEFNLGEEVASWESLDAETGTKMPKNVKRKIEFLQNRIAEYFNLSDDEVEESETENVEEVVTVENEITTETEINSEELLQFVKKNVADYFDESDVEGFVDELNSYKNAYMCVAESKKMSMANRNALVSIIAFSSDEDVDPTMFEEWLVEYCSDKTGFSADQVEEFSNMKESLEKKVA